MIDWTYRHLPGWLRRRWRLLSATLRHSGAIDPERHGTRLPTIGRPDSGTGALGQRAKAAGL